MANEKFTAGPWPVEPTGDGKRIIVGRGLVDGPGGYEVAEVYSDDCDWEEAKANAHLIAAAPELYEAAIDVAASLAAAISLLEKGGKNAAPSDKMFGQMLADYNASLERARTILRKARGEA